MANGIKPVPQESLDRFFTHMLTISKEVVAAGQQYGYGFSLVEIKFSDGIPTAVINSHTESKIYSNHEEAIDHLAALIDDQSSAGSQTFTIVRNPNGTIKRLLLDEYNTVQI